jgi:hypothetical protein
VQRSKAQIMAQRDAARTRKAKSRSGHTVTPTVTDTEVRVPETDTETDNPTPTPPPPEVVTRKPLLPAHLLHDPFSSVPGLKPSIDPCQVEALRRAREKTFGLPDRSAASSSTPVAPIATPQTEDKGATT